MDAQKLQSVFQVLVGAHFNSVINSRAVKYVGQSSNTIDRVRTDATAESGEHLKTTDILYHRGPVRLSLSPFPISVCLLHNFLSHTVSERGHYQQVLGFYLF